MEGIKEEGRMVDYNESLAAEEEAIIDQATKMIQSNEICPIFQVSSLSGQGMNQLDKFIYKLRTR